MEQPQALYEPLKVREIEVLLLMAEGLTNREIAARLYIGVETVRTYAKQIYRKLDVAGREEASRRAAELGLLDDAQAQVSAIGVNLPAQLSPFIGRMREIEQIIELLSGTRLLSLTGPGGSGKTRLSIEVAKRVGAIREPPLRKFTGGIHFVDLAPLSAPTQVAGAIAGALGIYERSAEPLLETLKRALGNREAMLLLIDNFEHVVAGAGVVPELLLAAPNLTVLATSREPLRVGGEQVYTVPPLQLPEEAPALPLEHLAEIEAVALFAQRAATVTPDFILSNENAAAVAAICQHLDGMPLAIELAASQTRLLTPQTIVERMDERFRTLRGGVRDSPARQRTLRATIDWSYNLLDAGEKTLFGRLAVFRGGRSLEAIESICAEALTIDVMDGLLALVDKNMVRRVEDRLGEARFIMLETIQEYALERLAESGEAEAMRQRHAIYFAELAERGAPHLRQADFDYWFKKFDIEHDNLRAALGWSLNGGEAEAGLRIIAALRDFWFYEGYHSEGQRWLELAFDHLADAPPDLRGWVLVTACLLTFARQDYDTAWVYGAEAVTIFRKLNNQYATSWALQMSSSPLVAKPEQYDLGIMLKNEAIVAFRELDDKPGLAQTLNSLGHFYAALGNYEQAQTVFEECLALCRKTGERRRESMMLQNLGRVAVGRGDYDAAERFMKAGLALNKELNFTYQLVANVGSLAGPAAGQGQPERAAKLLGASDTFHEFLGITLQAPTQLAIDSYLAAAREQLDEATFEAAWNAGRKLSLQEAVEYALGDGD